MASSPLEKEVPFSDSVSEQCAIIPFEKKVSFEKLRKESCSFKGSTPHFNLISKIESDVISADLSES